jgi:hypothetical protein
MASSIEQLKAILALKMNFSVGMMSENFGVKFC